MAGKTKALVELMRPKNMVLAAITVPLGAHFGMGSVGGARMFGIRMLFLLLSPDWISRHKESLSFTPGLRLEIKTT